MRNLISHLQDNDYKICSVFLVDGQKLKEPKKFLSASITVLSTILNLDVPNVNVITKMDLIDEDDENLENIVNFDKEFFITEEDDENMVKLTKSLLKVISTYDLVKYETVNITDVQSIASIISTINCLVQNEQGKEYEDLEYDNDVMMG